MSKKGRATDAELFAQLDNLSKDQAGAPKKGGKGAAAAAPPPAGSNTAGSGAGADALGDFGLPERSRSSGKHTPRSGSSAGVNKGSPKTAARAATPPVDEAGRASEDKQRPSAARKSGESARSFHTGVAPGSSDDAEEQSTIAATAAASATAATAAAGGWWSTITSTANAAVKQAEAIAKEIQKNEEAQKWAEQVKGNVTQLRGIGDELRSRAMPTFTTILHTLAPPISSHERLQIHITHDIVGYPSLDPLIYSTFSRVMAQVEGGELMVIQRGQESGMRRDSNQSGGFMGSGGGDGGWNDGPWWRQAATARNLGSVRGLTEGTKLSRVSAEAYATDYFSARGGLEEAAKAATEVLSESNPVRSSDIFLSIQAISQAASKELFGGSTSEQQQQQQKKEGGGVVEPEDEADNTVCFAIYLYDPIHGIRFATVSQSLPEKWVGWLDASATAETADSSLPQDIADIVNSGGVDPREWVAEWVEEVLTLGIGVIAQRYVARRMGVGQGGIGKGKARQEVVESIGGEAARAI